MTDPAVLFVRPKAIKPHDKAKLTKAGIIVVEIDDPKHVKFARPSAELDGSDLLRAAVKAINGTGKYESPSEAFGRALSDAILHTSELGAEPKE